MASRAMLVLELDGDVSGHLAIAVRLYRDMLRKHGMAEPPELEQLEQTACRVAAGGQKRSRVSSTVAVEEHRERAYLDRRQAANIAGASVSTVDRWIRRGELSATRRGRIVRIKRSDLDSFLTAA